MAALHVSICVYKRVSCNSLFSSARSGVLEVKPVTGAVTTCEHFLAEVKTWSDPQTETSLTKI